MVMRRAGLAAPEARDLVEALVTKATVKPTVQRHLRRLREAEVLDAVEALVKQASRDCACA
jgi:inactivated superfamily I helicase